MSVDCLFCKIIAGEVPSYKIYEDQNVCAFLNIYPYSKGHTLIIPKEHSEDLTAASKESALYVMGVLHDIAPKIVDALGATGYNLGMNHGADAGQLIFHTHLHVIPRYKNDERKFEKLDVTPEELEVVAEQIRAKI
ncbi:HIT family protein [Candidatus Uhrbacteria bacterium]|jgi:histidine triad (HIT) family protein|nr:HIT family protein [Candidatus Uhrbacteria bacterium]